jgi:hypothetical protein
MSFLKLYITILPVPLMYSTLMGIDAGIDANKKTPVENFMDTYANIIGYTGIGIITGLTYPVSYPLFASYVLFRDKYRQ